MRSSKLQLWFGMILLLIAGCDTGAKQESFEIKNPVLPGDRPDPTVIQIGDTYWASATSNEWSPLFPIFKSNDLQNWELVTYVFPDDPPAWAVNNFWAPELAYDEDQDKVYVYYTARDRESNRLSTAVASADSPEGPFTDHGPLISQELGSIDGYEARDIDGTLYFMWKEDGNSGGQPTPMWAQEINEDRTELIGEKIEMFRNDESWEDNLVEGISVFREDDYFYALYSARSCCDVQCNYVTGVARSETIGGPWEKFDGNPILNNNEDWKCPGHGSVVRKDGEIFYLHHAYSRAGGVYVGREAVLERIIWNEEGWPVFDNDAEYNRETDTWDFSSDFTEGLDPLWQWRVTQDIQFTTNEEGLFVEASRENEDLGSLLVRQTTSPNYDIIATIDHEQSGENVAGGIALVGAANNGFAAPVAAAGISTENGNITVWETRNAKTEIYAEEQIGEAEYSKLMMEVRDGYLLTFSVKQNEEWKTLVEDFDASHLVAWGMGFRYGMVAKGEPGGRVNIKEFQLINH
ncbi:glycoside hydrolase family 43 protein [Rhodohalobacter sp. 614A]|uniref:glycoside hydrolase family 43 protein n=1 Tax=Rhodohalobacter sp. 614A TaxID=2908649 RepID=UPI001F2E67F8|nr:glycoside hydrolase family 43 protein [Rhodohalobacter sp. 614A]